MCIDNLTLVIENLKSRLQKQSQFQEAKDNKKNHPCFFRVDCVNVI